MWTDHNDYMKKTWCFIAAILVFASCAKEEFHETTIPEVESKSLEIKYIPGSIVVKLDDSLVAKAESNPDALAQDLGFSYMERLFPKNEEFEPRARREGLHRYYKMYTEDYAAPVTKAALDIKTVPGVLMATPQLPVRPRAFQGWNDPWYDGAPQWGLNNTRTPKADINVKKVWDEFTTGSDKVIVAVLDEGVDMTHEDLVDNLIPVGEKGSWNFVTNKGEITTSDSHGTHVAGTIAAVNNNGMGVASMAGGDAANGKPGVKVMSCQMFGNATPDYVAAMQHAADNGAVIMNCSWGFSPDLNYDGVVTEAEEAAYREVQLTDPVLEPFMTGLNYFLKYAGCDQNGNQLPTSPMKGGVVVFASGNDNYDFDPLVLYEPLIAVGSYGLSGKKSSFSNYGEWLDIAAPGGDGNFGIYSCLLNNKYGGNDWLGTSFSAPHVSGLAALLVSYFGTNPDGSIKTGFTADECRTRIIRGAVDNFFPGTKYIGRKMDAYGSFTYDMDAPAKPPVITVQGELASSITYKEKTSVSFKVEDTKNELYTLSIEPLLGGLSFDRDDNGLQRLNVNGAYMPAGKDITFSIVATNESGLSSSHQFKMDIVGNMLPEMTPQGLLNVPYGAAPVKINLAEIITDPDEDPLTFTAESADDEVLEASVDGTILTLTARAEGRTSVTVAANDGYGSSSFVLDVYTGNLDGSASVETEKVYDKLTLKLAVVEPTEVDILIYNVTGSVAYQTKVTADAFNPATILLRYLAPGRYVLTANYAGRTEKLPFIKY